MGTSLPARLLAATSALLVGAASAVMISTPARASAPAVSISGIQGQFYGNPNNSGQIDTSQMTSPLWTQSFPVIDFNPPASAQVSCSNNTGINENSRPFTDVVPNPDGSCSTIIASNGSAFAGQNITGGAQLYQFQAAFVANLTVAQAGQVTFNFFSDDGWVLGAGPVLGGSTQPTWVSGSLLNPPAQSPINRYSVVGSFNTNSAPTQQSVVVSFPVAGTYPIEVDYTECCGGQDSLTLGTSFGNPIPPPSPSSVPGSPSITSAAPGQARTTLTWTAPSGSGAGPITSYTITSSAGQVAQVAGSATSGIITGLVSDCETHYTFTVTANNAYGSGPPSTPSGSVLPSGYPSNPPSAIVIMIMGFGTSMQAGPPGGYDPTDGSFSYCHLESASPSIPPPLVNLAKNFHTQFTSIPFPKPDLLDSIAATGAVILPYSYNGAISKGFWPGNSPQFTVQAYPSTAPSTILPFAAAIQLNAEVATVHHLWPNSPIQIVGHSEGGMVAETYWERFPSVVPAAVTNIFSLDSPINGVAKPDIAWWANFCLICPSENSIYAAAAAQLNISPRLMFSYFDLWNSTMGGTRDGNLIARDGNGPMTTVGTRGDIVYDGTDCFLRIGVTCYDGLNSQMLFNSPPSFDPEGDSASVSADFLTPGYPPNIFSVAGKGLPDLLVSHGFVYESPGVIQQITTAVNLAMGRPVSAATRAAATTASTTPRGSLSPTTASAGQSFTISGSNLGASAGQVLFTASTTSSVAASVTTWSDTQITGTVPSGAITGPVIVTTATGTYTPDPVAGETVLGTANGVASLQVTTPGTATINGSPMPITIKALNSSGGPVASVTVNLSDGYGVQQVTTDSTGTVVINRVGTGAETLVAFSGTASAPVSATWTAAPVETLSFASGTVNAAPGATVTLAAKLTNASGGVVPNQTVSFQSNGDPAASISATQATTDATGTATITAVDSSPGTLAVSAIADGFTAEADVLVTWGPQVTSVSPTFGAATGGSTVTISGSGFQSGATVRFGNTPANVTSLSATSITAAAPAASASATVDITVTENGQASPLVGADHFTYYTGAPSVTSLSPNAGSTAGGTMVTVSGNNFLPGATVKVGTLAGTGVTFVNAQTITFVTPAHSAGGVDVRVTTTQGTSAISAGDVFTYGAPPTVKSISPTNGPVGGGTSVTIKGTGFVTPLTVDFGANNPSTSVTVTSTGQLTAVSPPCRLSSGAAPREHFGPDTADSPNTAGGNVTVDIVVVTPFGQSATSTADQFTYIAGTLTCA